ncbi:hypothetical protein LCGC14_2642560 [marine sediment metagenome]|uniref:UDP-glucose/GDP-mannose dehydrogenase dimerisation domain-containing protein n=1 Tax=marine sediment metagenome TaxID=412755 RepID=A0A0F8ZX25_9ZZZZ
MNDDFRLGIVGFGFLGSSICFGFSSCIEESDIKIYDKYKKGFNSFEDTVLGSNIIFICLPTPAFKDNGEIDLRAITENLDNIHDLVDEDNDKIIVIKSTVPPGTTDMFAEKYPKLRFIMNPEFLTGNRAKLDFLASYRVILGGPKSDIEVVESLYRKRFGNSVLIFKTNRKSAELTKYSCNLFFFCKLIFLNTIFDTCDKLGLEYDEIRDMLFADARCGRSHMQVPGNDIDENGNKLRGVGNLCFPKDMKSFIFFAKSLGLDPKMLEAAWEQNLDYRPDKDWEKIPGAFSDR